jgi:hemoglobin-like flavoprotein
VLGEAVDETVLGAWGEAYWFLADVLIAREATLYTQAA